MTNAPKACQAPLAERVLHEPVLPRVIGDHGDDSSRHQSVTKRRERARQSFKLIIDRNAYCLKQPGEIRRSRTWPEHRADRADEIVADHERPLLAAADDLAGNPQPPRFVTVFTKDAGEVAFVSGVEQLGRRLAVVSAHPHVEYGAFAKGKAAGFVVELA